MPYLSKFHFTSIRKVSSSAPRSFILIATLLMISLLLGVIITSIQYGIEKAKIIAIYNQNTQVELLGRTAYDRTEGIFLESIRKNSSNQTGPYYFPKEREFISPPRLSDRSSLSKILILSGTNASYEQQTDRPSKSGRSISLSAWNQPKIEEVLQAPHWIYLTDERKNAQHSKSKVCGRFAFIAYDLGGLMDINQLAGSSSLNNAAKGLYNSMDQADLREIPGCLEVTQKTLDRWLLPTPGTVTLSVSDSRLSASQEWVESKIKANENNMTSMKGNLFLNRSDFLDGNHELFSLPEQALRFFSVGNLDLNVSSFDPALMSSPSRNPTLNAKFDRYLVSAPFTRRNGLMAKVGEPIIYDRFALSRIKNLTYQGPAGGSSASEIQRDFGLVWERSKKDWIYAGNSGSGAASTIKTMDQVAKENREPNFFELLKATVLTGSLGLDIEHLISTLAPINGNIDYQIIRIGANILDQFDDDSYPSSIVFAGYYLLGIENIPYFSQIFSTLAAQFPPPSTWLSNEQYLEVLYDLWNPHQLNPYLPSERIPPSIALTNHRGNSAGFSVYYLDGYQVPAAGAWPRVNWTYPIGNGNSNTILVQGDENIPNQRIDINAMYYSSYLNPNGVQNFSSKTLPNKAGLLYSGFQNYNGEELVLNTLNVGGVTKRVGTSFDNFYPLALSAYCTNMFVSLSFNQSGQNKIYTTFSGQTNLLSSGIKSNLAYGAFFPPHTADYSYSFLKVDPRTDRIGVSQIKNDFDPSSTGYCFTNTTARSERGLVKYYGLYHPTSGIKSDGSYYTNSGVDSWTSQTRIASVAENRYPFAPGGNCRPYSDKDGVTRWGDCGLNSDPTLTAPAYNPMSLNSTTNRPIILDRPALSRGELGYVFRDMPWKSLDLFTTNSADAGLLETFSARESGRKTGGKVNLNSAPKEVISALLSGKRRSEFNESDLISSSEAQKLAEDFIQKRKTVGGLHNLSELVTQISDTTVNSEKPASKMRREAVIRTLSETGAMRTWNLFFDLVVQSGVDTNNSEKPSAFRVEATKRYWVHLTIDRLTGCVLQRNIKPFEG